MTATLDAEPSPEDETAGHLLRQFGAVLTQRETETWQQAARRAHRPRARLALRRLAVRAVRRSLGLVRGERTEECALNQEELFACVSGDDSIFDREDAE